MGVQVGQRKVPEQVKAPETPAPAPAAAPAVAPEGVQTPPAAVAPEGVQTPPAAVAPEGVQTPPAGFVSGDATRLPPAPREARLADLNRQIAALQEKADASNDYNTIRALNDQIAELKVRLASEQSAASVHSGMQVPRSEPAE